MPEHRAHVDGRALSRSQTQAQRLHVHVNQRREAAQHVQAVRGT